MPCMQYILTARDIPEELCLLERAMWQVCQEKRNWIPLAQQRWRLLPHIICLRNFYGHSTLSRRKDSRPKTIFCTNTIRVQWSQKKQKEIEYKMYKTYVSAIFIYQEPSENRWYFHTMLPNGWYAGRFLHKTATRYSLSKVQFNNNECPNGNEG